MSKDDEREEIARVAFDDFLEAVMPADLEVVLTSVASDEPIEVPEACKADVILLPFRDSDPSKNVTLHSIDAFDICKILRQDSNVNAEVLDETVEVLVQESFQPLLPAIWLSAQAIISNPELLTVLLNVLSNYIYDAAKKASIFKGRTKLNIYVQREDGSSIHVSFEGPADRLDDVKSTIRAAAKVK